MTVESAHALRRVVDVCVRLLEDGSSAADDRAVVVLCDRSSVFIAEGIAQCVPELDVIVFLAAEGSRGTEPAEPSAPPVLPANCRLLSSAKARARVLDVATLPRPPELVVDYDGRPGRPRASAWEVLFGTLADGGHYVVRDNDKPVASTVVSGEPLTVRELVHWYQENAASVTQAHGRWAPELSRSIGAVRLDDDLTIVQKRGEHLIKVHMDEMEKVGAARWGETWADTLLRREPYTYSMPGRLTLGGPGPIGPDRRTISVPERVLRRHRDVTMSRRMVLRKENIALTESFHHPHQVSLSHPRLHDISRMVTRDPGAGSARPLAGSYFLLDTNYPGHFGHITTEVLGMMWGWQELRRRGIGARPIVSTYVEQKDLPRFQYDIFEAFSITPSDVEIVHGDDVVQVEELYTATQQMESPGWIDREIVTSWRTLRTHLRSRAREIGESGLGAERVFVSRRYGPKRNCLNTPEVEEYFRSRGFAVYFPEDHSYLHQVETFARAKKIAGFGGSGMFTMMFAPRAEILIVTSDGYAATNEFLLAAANGNDITYVWGPAEHRPVKMGRHDKQSFRANFVVDLAAHRHVLRRFTSRIRLW